MAFAGAVAGVVGGGISLLLCAMSGLARARSSVVLILGTLLLGITGAVVQYAFHGEQSHFAIYVVWQTAFAYVLAKFLRPALPVELRAV